MCTVGYIFLRDSVTLTTGLYLDFDPKEVYANHYKDACMVAAGNTAFKQKGQIVSHDGARVCQEKRASPNEGHVASPEFDI